MPKVNLLLPNHKGFKIGNKKVDLPIPITECEYNGKQCLGKFAKSRKGQVYCVKCEIEIHENTN